MLSDLPSFRLPVPHLGQDNMVENNIMLSCGKEYVKLAWEFICKPGRENLDFLQVKKSEMTGKTKKYCMY